MTSIAMARGARYSSGGSSSLLRFGWLERYAEFGPLFIRLIIGWHLVYGTQDNVFSYAQMLEFRTFLAQHGFPFPLVSAFVSVYAQFICGLLYLAGLFTRTAAFVMVINFVIALYMVHRGQSYPQSALALIMLFASLFLLLHGPGRVALDRR